VFFHGGIIYFSPYGAKYKSLIVAGKKYNLHFYRPICNWAIDKHLRIIRTGKEDETGVTDGIGLFPNNPTPLERISSIGPPD
jgi:hypothetical protein